MCTDFCIDWTKESQISKSVKEWGKYIYRNVDTMSMLT